MATCRHLQLTVKLPHAFHNTGSLICMLMHVLLHQYIVTRIASHRNRRNICTSKCVFQIFEQAGISNLCEITDIDTPLDMLFSRCLFSIL